MTDSPISLTGRERRALKSRAKTLPLAVKFGRKGLTETALRELSRSLDLGDGLANPAAGPGDDGDAAVNVFVAHARSLHAVGAQPLQAAARDDISPQRADTRNERS